MSTKFKRIKRGGSFCLAIKYFLQISSMLLYEKNVISTVSSAAIFATASAF